MPTELFEVRVISTNRCRYPRYLDTNLVFGCVDEESWTSSEPCFWKMFSVFRVALRLIKYSGASYKMDANFANPLSVVFLKDFH